MISLRFRLPVGLGFKPEVSVHAVAAITAELDAVGCHTSPAPGLQRCAADAAGVAADGDKGGGAWLNDDHVFVAGFAKQGDTAIAALCFTHDFHPLKVAIESIAQPNGVAVPLPSRSTAPRNVSIGHRT